jgi:putative tricarboxylic transport membrane protein
MSTENTPSTEGAHGGTAPGAPGAGATPATAGGPTSAAGLGRPPIVERHIPWAGPRLVGLAVLGLGIASLIGTAAIPSSQLGWSVEGPRFVPGLAAVALIVLSAIYLVRTFWRPDVELARFAANESEQTTWETPGGLITALVAYALLLSALGYGLATTVFIWLVSWLLGSEEPRRDAIVAVVLGVGVSYAFSRWLGVRLPTGPWGV